MKPRSGVLARLKKQRERLYVATSAQHAVTSARDRISSLLFYAIKITSLLLLA